MGFQSWPNNDPSNNNATVRAATTANITIATALNNGDTLDGVTLATGDLVLVKNQSAPADNGIYTVGVVPVRSTSYTAYNDYPGIIVSITEGTTNADTAWVCTSNSGGTLGVTAISFAAFGTGTIGGSVGTTDNGVPRADGTGGLTLQGSVITIADTTGVIAGTQGVTFTGSSSGTTALVPTAAASGTITIPAATDTLVGKATTDTLTNKTFDADGTGNSITNIENADIKAAAAIAVNKLAALTASEAVVTDGSGFLATATGVSATEVGYLNGVSSGIQGQIDAKQATISFGTGVETALGVNIGSAGAPVLFNGAGGTPSSMTGTNITGTAAGLTAGTASAVAVGGITGLGTGVATALAINVGSAGAPVVLNGAGGTPSSITLTNASGTAASLTAGTVTTNANLTGPITSTGNATAVASQTGTGSTFVMQTSPTLTTPNIGVATATSVNGLTITSSTGTLTVTNGKTATVSNTLTFSGTDGSTVTLGTGGTVLYSGGALGTPSSGVATNLTGTAAGLTAGAASAVALGGITGLGTNVATALAVNVGSAGAFVTFNGALGTPSSGTLTNATGLPVSTGISGLGTNVATALAVNVGSAGAFITFNGAGGTPSSMTLTNATGLPISTGVSGLGTDVATQLALNANGSDVDAIGFRGIPQNSQADNYTLVLADAGKHIYETGASKTVTIPANGSVAYEIGTAVTFIATNATGCSIAITTDTMTLAGTTTTGTRTLAQNGVATAIKVASTSWIISGTGLT